MTKWKKFNAHFDLETGIISNVPFEPILVTNGKWVEYINEHGWDKQEYYFHNGTGKLEGVTHFMPIPTPPTE